MPDASQTARVESLIYTLRESATVSYKSPPPVSFETDTVRFTLAEGRLEAEMRITISDVEEAQKLVEPVLRAWELKSRLANWSESPRFEFDTAKVVQPPGNVGLLAGTAHMKITTHPATLHLTKSTYPDPPLDFRVTPDVETLANRYEGMIVGREPLPSAAYACLTLIEGVLAGKQSAAIALNVSVNVLETLGRLASRKGDARTARKLDQSLDSLSGAEEEWIKVTLRHLIARMGDQRAPDGLGELTLAELPPLK